MPSDSEDDELLQDLGGILGGSSRANLPAPQGAAHASRPKAACQAAAPPSAQLNRSMPPAMLDLTGDDEDDPSSLPLPSPGGPTAGQAGRAFGRPLKRLHHSPVDEEEEDSKGSSPVASPSDWRGEARHSARELSQSPNPSPGPRRKAGKLSEEEKASRTAAREADREAKRLAKQQDKADKAAQRAEQKAQRDSAKAADKEQRAKERTDQRRARGAFALQDVQLRLNPTVLGHQEGWKILQVLSDCKYQFEHTESLVLHPLRCCQWRWRAPAASSEASQEPASQSSHDADSVPYVAVWLTAEEFVEEAERDELTGLVNRSAWVLPGYTLCLLVTGLDLYLTQRERCDFRAAGPGGGGFSRHHTDQVVASLAVRWPGVRFRSAQDAQQAAEHLVALTRNLGEQPYAKQNAFLGNFGGNKTDLAAARKVLADLPLAPDKRVLFNALGHTPELGPPQAHAIADEFGSLGCLMAQLMDPAMGAEKRIATMARSGSDRKVGPAAAAKLVKILCATEPGTLIAALPGAGD